MDNYLSDPELKRMISDITVSYNRLNHAHKFYSNAFSESSEHKQAVLSLTEKYRENICDKDLLDSISILLLHSKIISPCRLMLKIARMVDERLNLKIIKYVLNNFEPKELEKCKSEFQFKFFDFQNWIEYIDLFAGQEMKFIQDEPNNNLERHNRKLFHRYLKQNNLIHDLKKENELLREKIKSLEIEIDYIPGGKGYQEAKEHFEDLNN